MDPDPGSMNLALMIIGLVGCLFILALTSAADSAMTLLTRRRIKAAQAEDASREAVVQQLLNDPYRFKAATLFLNALALIGATVLTLLLVQNLTFWAQAGALLLLFVLVLVFGEALPKALVLRNPQRAAGVLARPMSVLGALFWPLIALTDALLRPLVRWLSGGVMSSMPLVSDEELRHLVNVGEEEGVFQTEEREMIEGIISFGDTVVREVMVPRVDIVALEAATSLDKALDVIIKYGHSRIPVYDETIDQIHGVLYAKDILPRLKAGADTTAIGGMVREPYFVPDSMKVDALLRELQSRKVHLAIVVDEYGGTAGLATIEDLLEEIVGEIQDEYDAEEPALRMISDGEVLADARALLDDINDETGLHLESDESDRIGGLVYEHLGRVPRVDDQVELPGNVKITVLSVEGLGPRQLRIAYQPQHSTEEQDSEHVEVANHDPT